MIIIVSKAAPPDHSGAGKRMYNFFLFLRSKGYNVKYVTNTQIYSKDIIVIKKHFLEKCLSKLNPVVTFMYTFAQLSFNLVAGSFSSNDTIRTVWLVSASPLTSAAGLFFYMSGYRVITQNVLIDSDDPGYRPPGPLKITYRLRKLQYRISHVVTSISPGLYELSKPYHPHCIMIPNPVELQEDKNPAKSDKKDNVLIVGRLSFRKGTDIAFKTIDLIHTFNPEINFTFVGPYDDMDKQLKQIYDTSENINKTNVIFTGYQIDTRPWYMKADILFLPSRKEGFGTVFIEAMAHGLPVVAKKLPGVTDYIFNNGYTTLIDSEDPYEYAKAILRLVGDSEYYVSLVKKIQNNVIRFEKESIYEKYLQLIVHQ